MFDTETIRADHKDVIHDVNYDYYGKRMATCSSDQTVKVNDILRLSRESFAAAKFAPNNFVLGLGQGRK